MRLADFDYSLPDELIARYPTEERRASRLLLLDPASGACNDRRFDELPELLRPNDLLVFNDTRVIKARLHGRKDTGGRVEILIERQLDDREALAHVRSSKTPKCGSKLQFGNACTAVVTARHGALMHLQFDRPLMPFLESHGEVPLPPYLQRAADSRDDERYQTVYARRAGAVAAPTAGLHFDEEMLAELARAGIRQEFVTLHVGAGTFQNLRESQVEENSLHGERVEVSQAVCDAVAQTRAQNGRVVAVGTTSVRALEAASTGRELAPFQGETDLFIRPGYTFQTVDAILTNFHLPQSSLLILVATFAGLQTTLQAYRHAVAARYRFFSYGDAMLIQSRANQ
ncbi:MAG: tRNA preQ1(34) S-adenosylmethionine ribosyltransferase-isomerase QueA [Woeseia sp.]|nr:tRNA preQ1(34) S-adenosylmethionine ribosyltransferase-isomerase QueA [Woeseia sp.]MBT8097694.1 tRNA preQ1(34) S-adenosylmethionine ribosyltransferase-isomerase QueA [Woeseia sp.]NNE59996.1 tRNA preQ1(34) S-adenosylmethionine ribosyltransferase-isomerase QueA [Woeseia sp.]NNL55571.1 tRNA preQ1(34) S-adenosylmethionine ribosyltransferase-isomerase QueA [Woeseia sp.]